MSSQDPRSIPSLTSLPTLEELRRAGDGYDVEAVREAFDSFRRHAAQLQAQLRVLQAAVADNPVTVVFGESGSGKSALVKSVLDGAYPSWNQVWFGPEYLKKALSAANPAAQP